MIISRNNFDQKALFLYYFFPRRKIKYDILKPWKFKSRNKSPGECPWKELFFPPLKVGRRHPQQSRSEGELESPSLPFCHSPCRAFKAPHASHPPAVADPVLCRRLLGGRPAGAGPCPFHHIHCFPLHLTTPYPTPGISTRGHPGQLSAFTVQTSWPKENATTIY